MIQINQFIGVRHIDIQTHKQNKWCFNLQVTFIFFHAYFILHLEAIIELKYVVFCILIKINIEKWMLYNHMNDLW